MATFTYSKPLELFSEKKFVKICAPMVRYSKLPFRMLVRQYDCDLAFTPMIVSESFVKSSKARDSEFTTCAEDRPLIVQFAANNGKDLADATELISDFADGVDLNCGCPQRWAMAEGYGACLISKPDLVKDMIRQAKARISDTSFTISIKIRIHHDIRDTVELCRRAEKAGASFITVHGRTREQRNQPVNLEAIKVIKDSVTIPVVANGDIRTLEQSKSIHEATGVDGVMAARGMLENPAMYSGFEVTPVECIQKWVHTSISMGTAFQYFHHHLIYMLERSLPRAERRIFNALSSTSAVINYLCSNYEIHLDNVH